jgi:hypothetical protein
MPSITGGRFSFGVAGAVTTGGTKSGSGFATGGFAEEHPASASSDASNGNTMRNNKTREAPAMKLTALPTQRDAVEPFPIPLQTSIRDFT